MGDGVEEVALGETAKAGSRGWAGRATAVGPLSYGAQDPICN
jgi:hypothetical protein